jgi:hypothetical protein
VHVLKGKYGSHGIRLTVDDWVVAVLRIPETHSAMQRSGIVRYLISIRPAERLLWQCLIICPGQNRTWAGARHQREKVSSFISVCLLCVIAFINRSTRMDYAVSFYDGRAESWSIVQPASRFERSKISESIVSSLSGFADVKCIPGGAYSCSGEQCLNSACAIDLGDAQSCVSSVAVVVVLYFLYISRP